MNKKSSKKSQWAQDTHEVEPPEGSHKVLGIKKYPSVGYSRRSPSPSREGPSPSTTKDSRPVQVANASADPIFSYTEISIPKNLAITSTAKILTTMASNQVSTAQNQTATSRTLDPAPFPMTSASMTPPPTHQSAPSTRQRNLAEQISGTRQVSSKVRSHAESLHDALSSMSFKSAPLQRSLMMQTSSPSTQPFPKPAKHLGSSYARSLISNCTSSPIRQSISTPMGECRARSPASINRANGEKDPSNEGHQSETNAEASSNARTRSQTFSCINSLSEMVSQRVLPAQPSVQDTFVTQAGTNDHLPYGQFTGTQFVLGIKPISPPFFNDCSQATQRSAREKYWIIEIE